MSNLKDYIGVNYHRWPICQPACECGSKLQVPVYKFLKEPIIRAFGGDFFEELEVVNEELKNQKH